MDFKMNEEEEINFQRESRTGNISFKFLSTKLSKCVEAHQAH